MSQTILVIEDTDLLRRIYTDRLAQDGHRMLGASDGLEALSILRSETPSLVLLDLIMPKMSGLEVLEIMKKDPRLSGVPVIILSNLGQDEDMQRGLEMGAIDYMIKNDARPDDIAEKVKAVIARTSSNGTARSYRLLVQDRVGDSDAFITQAGLTRRFWCPSCEVELNLEMLAQANRPGWYDAHLMCPMCGREY